jgi:uncharacterized protein (TIGR02246 family)
MRATALGLILLSSVPATASAQAGGAQGVRAAIEKANSAFAAAFKAGDFAALGAMYAEDAIAFPPDADMVRGRAAIQAMWAGIQKSGVKSVALTTVDVQSSGTMASEVGTAVLTIQPAGKPETTQNGKYVVVWKATKDGTWQLHRDIWNGMPSAGSR